MVGMPWFDGSTYKGSGAAKLILPTFDTLFVGDPLGFLGFGGISRLKGVKINEVKGIQQTFMISLVA